MKYCFVGPPLFGKTLSKSESWTKQFEYFEKVLIPAYKERNCDTMVIAGPMFETKQKIEWSMLLRFKKLFKDVTVWYLPGPTKEPFIELLDFIHVWTEPFLVDGILMIPYMNNEKIREMFNDNNKYDKLITNADVTGIVMTERDICVSHTDKHHSNGTVLHSPYMLDPDFDQNMAIFYNSDTKQDEILLNTTSKRLVRMKIETIQQIEELEAMQDSTLDMELEVDHNLLKDPKMKKRVKALMLKQGIKRLTVDQDEDDKPEEVIVDLSNLFDVSKMKNDIIKQISSKIKSDPVKVTEALEQVFVAAIK